MDDVEEQEEDSSTDEEESALNLVTAYDPYSGIDFSSDDEL